ncbi:hypothetical protein EIP91_009532 [Steccherinum ochraceum]|uniref:Uncharacterized protein n=1 Tax=Steccherinum ochraceum TaxID=92696 RepID=A0A4R0R6Y8_9APHY|nr:hypothetical protein EIP91_009532 [Steccherinum ochraceum]
MPLKASLSPSAPAPPVKDTDFPSFGDKLPTAPAQIKSQSTDALSADDDATPPAAPAPVEQTKEKGPSDHRSPSPLPMNKPPTARREGLTHQGSPSVSEKLGPIGSPPLSSPRQTSRVNGFSPGSSPAAVPVSSSPFSAPGHQTTFMLQQSLNDDFKARSGLSASLGATMTWGADRMQASKSRPSGGHSLTNEVVVEDEDLEEFIPGSLSDLLTPEERSRRFSRNAPTRPNVAGLGGEGGGLHPSGVEAHHRYSRSVPAPSLLEDIRSIWATDGAPPGTPGTSVMGGGLGNGTPSSFQSNPGSMSARMDEMLAPSNASAAFLPGLHHYINSKPATTTSRPGMQTLYPQTASGTHTPLGNAYQQVAGGMALSPPRLNSFAGHSGFDAPPSEAYLSSQARLGVGRGAEGYVAEGDRNANAAMSPSARALQAHAPGQSLPQGLAAGYSRIHALPPPVIPSPSTSAAFSPGRTIGFSPATKAFGHSSGPSGEWGNLSPNTGTAAAAPELPHVHAQGPPPPGLATTTPSVPPGLGGLETMFSRLSYSAAASRPSAAPPGIVARNPSGRGYNGPGATSPLSGPVLTGDDDDVFSMDG